MASYNNKSISQGECQTRFPPCSTFKIAISIMGFDSGILIDETHPTWDFKPGYVDWRHQWRQPHNPQLWFQNSCVWYSQIVTGKLGMEKFAKYTQSFDYGNSDISGDKGMNNGLTNSWLSSSLTISAQEQLNFITKLVTNKLPVSVYAHNKTKNIMYQKMLDDGWQLYGKTGNCSQLPPEKEKQVGWFVGFVKKENEFIPFVELIADDEKQDSFASIRAKKKLEENITSVIKQLTLN